MSCAAWRENQAAGRTPQPRLAVIRDATLEVRGPVVYATLVVIAVFLPELFSTSVQGHFVGPLALAFILAVLASLLVALTAAPALSALMLKARDDHADFGWIQTLKARQSARDRGGPCAISALVVAALGGADAVAAVAALPFLPSSFMPDFREGHFVMQVMPPRPAPRWRKCWRWASASAPKCWPCPMSPPSRSRSAAPNWARTPAARTRANSMSN